MDRDRLMEKRRLRTLIRASLEGVALVPEETRYGPGSLARHVVGHVRAKAYADPRDNAGESGLERVFDESLRGGEPAWAGVVTTGVFVEEGGDGPSVAAPIFRDIASLVLP